MDFNFFPNEVSYTYLQDKFLQGLQTDTKPGPHMIIEDLYLGGEEDARDVRRLLQLGISAVFNCVGQGIQTGKSFYGNKFAYAEIYARDNAEYNISEHFEEVIHFIEENRDKRKKVLIHCQAGVSRSPTLVIAYLMAARRKSLKNALDTVYAARPFILPDESFFKQLIAFEKKLQLEGYPARSCLRSSTDKVEEKVVDEPSGEQNTILKEVFPQSHSIVLRVLQGIYPDEKKLFLKDVDMLREVLQKNKNNCTNTTSNQEKSTNKSNATDNINNTDNNENKAL